MTTDVSRSIPPNESLAPPDLDYVDRLMKEYGDYYQQFHSQIDETNAYFNNNNAIAVPEGFTDVIHTGAARSLVNTATDHVDTENLQIDVPLSERSMARAERLQKFYQGVWLSQKRPSLRTCTRHCFAYEIGFTKTIWRSDLWPDAPALVNFESEEDYKEAMKDFLEKRKIVFPIDITAVNPRNLIWDDSTTGPHWAIETHEATAGELRKWYPQWMSRQGNDDPVVWAEYWDETWFGVLADGQWLQEPYEHGYGFMPYVKADPGLSIEGDRGKPEDRYQGMIYTNRELLDAEGRIFTAAEVLLKHAAWDALVFRNPSRSAAEADADEYEIGPGVKNVIDSRTNVDLAPRQQIPQEVFAVLGIVDSRIERNTYPGVVKGQRPTGISTGYGVSVLAGMGRLSFGGVANALSRMIEQINSNCAKLVENKARGSVTVHARSDLHNFDQTITPKDINGLYENKVSIRAEAPEERERQSSLAMQLHSQGIISLYEAMRRSGIINPFEEMNQIAAERVVQMLAEFQAQQAAQQLAGESQPQQPSSLVEQAQSVMGQGTNLGQFQPGMAQPVRPAESAIQQRRMATRENNERAFPVDLGGMDQIGSRISAAGGGGTQLPSGGRSP
jgi:hypothetical protein